MRLIRESALAATLIALSLVAPVPAQTIQAGGSSEAEAAFDLSKIRIRNFGRINPKYYRGAQPKDHDYGDLAALGVKTVINLTSDDADAAERTMVESVGMRYVQIPMTTHEPPTDAKLSEFFGIVDDAAHTPVYVHCVGGRHRTGVMTAAYRMSRDGWDAKQAFREMKQYDFGADFLHREFKDFVFDYGAQVARKAAANAVAAPARVAR
ncbi:MAG TPA: dual specificity protein phosphatase family protein [Vicinamibacterales bacterium]|nr:dual specificity protein phosphatase family protein [Vicinamibacterales bacterium]